MLLEKDKKCVCSSTDSEKKQKTRTDLKMYAERKKEKLIVGKT